MENFELLKLLADETRLEILRRLMREDSYVEKLAGELGLTPATVCYHLKKLESAGLVSTSRSQFRIIYTLDRTIFDRPLSDFLSTEPLVDPEEKYRRDVLSRFFSRGKLTSLPAQRKKRAVVLAEIAKSFGRGRWYTETEVDEIIHRVYDDHCLVRREMIAEGLMGRDDGRYRLL